MIKIQAIILDIDGVIIGEKSGFNFPEPHPEIIAAMRRLQNSGIPIILCTAKPNFAIRKIIEAANLDNLHITDGGGVVIDPLNHKTLQVELVPSQIVKKIVKDLLDSNIYTEIYTTTEYVIQTTQAGNITAKHETVIQSPPRQVLDLVAEIDWLDVTKIMPISHDLDHKKIVDELLQKYLPDVVVSWGVHPIILPLQFGIVTAPGISKAIAASIIMKSLSIDAQNVLGVGDSKSDWQFIEACGFGVAMGNAQSELKTLILSKGTGRSFIAPSVDENGLLAVFRKFNLID